MKDRIALMVAALWWGSATSIGFLVVPMLFARLATPAIAGNMAGQLFSAQTWVTVACALVLIVHARSKIESRADASVRAIVGLAVTGLMLALLQEYAVSPRILARDNLRFWHAAGSAMYLGQWLCAGLLLWRLSRR